MYCSVFSLFFASSLTFFSQFHSAEGKTDFDKVTVKIDPNSPDHKLNFQQFLSRPDIDAPRWEVQVHDKDAVSPGYWFMTPYTDVTQKTRGGNWVGPHIYDGSGELVWSGIPMFNGFNAFDFRVSNVRGENMLTLVYRKRIGLILDDTYTLQKSVDVTEGFFNVHDFNFVENGTRALLLNTKSKKASKKVSKAVGYKGQCSATFNGFEEFDTATWQPIFSWNAVGHIDLAESYYQTDKPIEKRCPGWDFMHANAIDKFPDGDYLLSSRHTNTIFKISARDGSIVWRLGGRKSNFKQQKWQFSGQHDARVRGQNSTHQIISFLDNAISGNIPETTFSFSRGLLVSLNMETMEAEIIKAHDHPLGDYAHGRGSYQPLPNGNTFVGWTQASLHSEYAPDGKLVMEAVMKADLKTYRSYKYPWVGRPTQPPDVYSIALSGRGDTTVTSVHVSWNGATEVATWNLYKTDHTGQAHELVASIPRTGFETALTYQGFAKFVVAEALDRHGQILGKSVVTRTIPPSDMSSPDILEGEHWVQDHALASTDHALAPAVSTTSFHEESPNDEPSMLSKLTSDLDVNTTIFAFVGGVVFCVLACLMVVAIRMCRSRPKAVSWWRPDQVEYEHVSEADEDAKEDEHDSDGYDEKESVRIRSPPV